MKQFLLVSLFYLFTYSSERQEKYYYFGIARPIKINASFNTVLYTDLKDTVCTRTQLHSLSIKWKNFVSNRCGDSIDCGSDFSYYITKELAEKNLNKAIKTYENLYILEKVNF